MNRILITGASGFIGRQVVLALRGAGDEIHTAQHTARMMSDSRNHTVDLTNPQQIDRLMQRVQPTHLVHLAWYTEHGKYWKSPLNLDWVTASIKLFQAFIENGGRRAVFAGTCAEYDWSAPSPLHEENSPSSPSSLYGACKNSLRQIIERFAIQSSVEVAWGRIFFLYGPEENQNRLIPSILTSLQNNQPALVKSGSHIRNLMHVRDAGRAFAHILHSSATGTINIASQQTVTLGNVTRMIGDITGRSHLLQIHSAEGTAQNPQTLTADTSRLVSLGFVPGYSLEQGLAELVADGQLAHKEFL